MATNQADGGVAFPQPARPDDENAPDGEGGMSLREWYAGRALSGLMAAVDPVAARVAERLVPDVIAKRCFDIAEAMILEERRRSHAS